MSTFAFRTTAPKEASVLSLIPELPVVIPPTSRLNYLRNWWQRSERTSIIAEARLLLRVPQLETTAVNHPFPLLGVLSRVPIDAASENNEGNPKKHKLVNTFYVEKQPSQEQPFVLKTKRDLSEMIDHQNTQTRNLVICHGYGAGLGFFYKNYGALAQAPGWRVFGIDWLGMGRSSRPKWTIFRKSKQTWEDITDEVECYFVQSLEEWRIKVGLNKMTLMGHSLGGYFSVCYALKYPERVEKLILVSPAGIGEHSPWQVPSWVNFMWDKHITPMRIARLAGPFGPSLVNLYTSRRFAHLDVDDRHDLYDYLYHITASSGSGEYALAAILSPSTVARKPLMKRLSKLTMPTTFAYGEDDWMDYRLAEKAKRSMAVPTKVIRIPDAGHHLYLDNPDIFNKVILKEMCS